MARAEAIEPVRFYAEDDLRLPRRLSKFLKDQIEQRSFSVLQGELSADEYKKITGQISGLRVALDECEAIEAEIRG